MQRLSPLLAHPLYDTAATRLIEQAAARALPPHSLMQRAGLAVARLALAVAPHARQIWIACGPGNNGGDGLEAAMHLHQAGKPVVASWLGDAARAPADALASLRRAQAAGVPITAHAPSEWDLAIDALLGIGAKSAPQGTMADWISRMNRSAAPVLAVDLPSGLQADTGQFATTSGAESPDSERVSARWTLSLLTLKPGLFTAGGRDCTGEVWLDTLGVDATAFTGRPSACLQGAPAQAARLHASHKGSYGDVAVLGGAPGMTGAALLAATAALHGGAGRVFVGLLDGGTLAVDALQPELMFRPVATLDLQAMTVVCGCGGGTVVGGLLPRVLAQAPSLVLDADALNAIAASPTLQGQLGRRQQEGRATVLTPHPLEAARLLGMGAAAVQADRVAAAQGLADRLGCVVVLKGSGTVIACPGTVPVINPTGNARLASAGTGDVLAGLIGARLAAGLPAPQAAAEAAYRHGAVADAWPESTALSAGRLARALRL